MVSSIILRISGGMFASAALVSAIASSILAVSLSMSDLAAVVSGRSGGRSAWRLAA